MMKLSTSFPRSFGRIVEFVTVIRVVGRSLEIRGRARNAGDVVVVPDPPTEDESDWVEFIRDVEDAWALGMLELER